MKTYQPRRFFYALLFSFFAFATMSFIAPARAELLFSDSFDYPPGSLIGDGPPAGAPPGQSAWMLSYKHPRVKPGGLTFSGVLSGGNAAAVRGLQFSDGDKAFATFGGVTPDLGTAWVGFLINQDVNVPATDGYAVVSLGNVLDGPVPGVGLLYLKGVYGIDNDTGLPHARASVGIQPSRDVVWLVTKLDFTNAMEYVWANPDPTTEPDIRDADAKLPMTDYFLQNGFSEVQLRIGYNNAGFKFDELRIGTTYFDVVGSSGQ